MVELDCAWASDDAWKDGVMRRDSRSERCHVPQHQCAEDSALADPDCPTCIWPAAAGLAGEGR